MAHKKGQGSSRNGRDSNSQRLGVKQHDGNVVSGGSILVRQKGRRFNPGLNVGLAKDHSLYAKVDGKVRFEDHGQRSNRTGQAADDLDIHVPTGTLVFQRTGGESTLVADLAHEGQRVLVARGGRGGRGNAQFVSSTNRAPRRTEPGEAGEEKSL